MPKNRVQFFAKDAACPPLAFALQDEFDVIGTLQRQRVLIGLWLR
jgi:hypothetical protein